jgi:hypothetical protein
MRFQKSDIQQTLQATFKIPPHRLFKGGQVQFPPLPKEGQGEFHFSGDGPRHLNLIDSKAHQ